MKRQSVQVNNKHNCGFTLIELLVAIVIMTILTGIGAGMFTGSNQKLEVQKAANSLLIMAQFARMSAVEQQRAYKIYLDTKTNEFYVVTTLFDEQSSTAEEIVVEDSLCTPVVLDESITIEDVRVLSNDYNSRGKNNDAYIITFAPDGTSQAAVVQIGDQLTHYTLSINEITGKSKLYTGTIDEVKTDTIDIDAEYL
jgi:prepilin-type N-terminal cleavage/methylation domain-containing protein